MAMSRAELEAKLAAAETENAALKAARQGKVTWKVSAKGALSTYGLGRFPVTLYGSQWKRLFEHAEEIKRFIDENDGKTFEVTVKDDKGAATVQRVKFSAEKAVAA